MSAAKLLIPGSRVILESFTREHISTSYLSWLSDADVVRYSNQRFLKHSYESCESYLHSFHSSPNLFLAIQAKASHAHIGTITIYCSPQHGTADIGIMLGEKTHWGQGLGSEAFSLAMQHAFTNLQMRKVTAGTVRANVGMIRIMEKAQMHLEATRARHMVFDGQEEDVLLYAKFRPAG